MRLEKISISTETNNIKAINSINEEMNKLQ